MSYEHSLKLESVPKKQKGGENILLVVPLLYVILPRSL